MAGCLSIRHPRTSRCGFGIRAQSNFQSGGMKVLFDVNVPQPLRRKLSAHEIVTAQELGWGELENGDLIRAAELKFDVLITADQNLKYQQNLKNRKLAIIVLPGNRLRLVLPLADKI